MKTTTALLLGILFFASPQFARAQAKPSVKTQPQSQTVPTGATVTFSITVGGQSPLSYQWYFNSAAILNNGHFSGAQTTTLTVSNATVSDSGNYFAIVSNGHGSTTSSNAVLVVNPLLPPRIDSFTPASAVAGATLTISGANFVPVSASNVVFFGAVRATILSATKTNLTVTVPVGATYAPITVEANSLIGFSSQPFQPTFLGDGQPVSATTFAPRQDIAIGSGNLSTVIADLDGDGKADLAVDNGSSPILLFRNIATNGSLSAASFAPAVSLVVARGTSNNPYGFVVADMDNDGKLDLLFSDAGNNRIGICRNLSVPGNFTTNSFAAPQYFSTGATPPYFRVRDLDGDGRSEIVACNSGGDTISILRNTSAPGVLAFAPKVDLATGSGPFDVAIQDLDGDGKPDLAVAHIDSAFISVFRNISTAGAITTNSFAAKTDFPSLANNMTIIAGDVDGDGKPELLAGGKSSVAQIYQNLSAPGSLTTNSFAAAVNFPSSGWIGNIALSDINGDGRADIIFEGQLSSYMAVYQNQSTPGVLDNSSLANRVDYESGYNAFGMSVGDLDGDGRPDVVFCNIYDSTTTLYRNATPLGTLEFSLQPSNIIAAVGSNVVLTASVTGKQPVNFQWLRNGNSISNDVRFSGTTTTQLNISNAQTNDSGSYQLVASNSFGSVTSQVASVTIFIVPPVITQQPQNQAAFVGGSATFTVSADGTQPLFYQWFFNDTPISNGANSATLSINNLALENQGLFSVQVSNAASAVVSSNATLVVNALFPGVPHIANFAPQSALIGATLTISGSNFSSVPASNIVYFGTVRANVISSSETNLVVTVPVGATYAPITVMVNGLVGYANAPFEPTFFGDGNPISGSTFSARADLTGTYGNFESLIADLDGDGKPDFVFSVSQTFALFRNTGPTTNALPVTFAPRADLVSGSSNNIYGFVAADVDGDGKLDLVFCDNANSRIGILKNVSTPGTLASNSFAPPIYFNVPGAPYYARVQDLDFDGKPEISVACGSGISIFKNLSSPGILDTNSFGNRIDLASGAGAYDVAVQDLDGDGKPDLAVTHQSSAFISVFRNIATPGTLASSSFEPKVDFASLSQNFTIVAADIDGDGKADLLTGGKGSTLQVYRNLSTAGSLTSNSLAAPVNFGHPGWVHNIAMGDINGDGKPDIVIVGELGSYMRVNQNKSTPGIFNSGSITPIDFGTGWNPWGVSVGDIDGDGRPDVAFCNNYDGTITFYKNATPFGGPASISIEPTNSIVSVGSNIVLTASVSGQNPLTFQWLFNGISITNDARVSGTTTNLLNISNAQTSDSGNYQLIVSNSFGAVTSVVALVSVVILPPTISQQPQSQLKALGSTATLAAQISGTAPFSFQWFFNDSPLVNGGRISGANSNALVINNLQTNDTGNYFLIVTNLSGAVTSDVVALEIGIPPSISLQPASQTNLVGSNVTFTVATDGSTPLNYQWRLNGVNVADDSRITGSTNATLIISDLRLVDGGNHDVIITNSVGSVTSSVALLTIYQLPTFAIQPTGRSVVPGLPTTLSASVTGTTPLSFQWQLNGTNVVNATNQIFSLTAVSSNDFGIYTLVASNSAGVTISTNAPLIHGEIAVWGNNSYGQTIVPQDATNIIMICAGNGTGSTPTHTLALRGDGKVIGWGNNTFGEASPPASLSNVVSIACGQDHSVALLADGTVFCWGSNTVGQTNVPPGLSNVIAIAAGSTHSLALRSDGKVFAWGANVVGQTNVPSNLNKVVAIAAGVSHSLAIRDDGTVVAWGNSGRSVGYYSPGGAYVPAGLDDVVAVAGGDTHNIALLSNQTVFVWGNTNFGLQSIPTNATMAIAVSAAADYSMALRTNGTVAVWGFNSFGQTNVPSGVSNVVAIAAGSSHALALVSNGRPMILQQPVGGTTFVGRNFSFNTRVSGNGPLALQWQFNGVDVAGATNSTLVLPNLSLTNAGNYQLIASNSLGVATSISVPLNILDSPSLSFLNVLPSVQTNFQGAKVILSLGVAGNGPLKYQWKLNGTNIAGATNEDLVFDPIVVSNTGSIQLVVSNSFTSVSSIVSSNRVLLVKSFGYLSIDPPLTLTNAVALAVGDNFMGTVSDHYLALRSDGKIFTWATNIVYGETNLPASVTNSIITAISAGRFTSMALRSDGIPVAWGEPSNGITNVPAAANNVIAIASGDLNEMALRADGTVVVWGTNVTGMNSVPGGGASNVVGITAGMQHALALRSDGTVVSWGYNGSGQTNVPVGATNVIAFAAGANHSLALRANGTVLQWGSGIANYPVPASATNVVAISAAQNHNVALRADGSLVVWGFYYNGSASITNDFANVIQIASGGDHDLVMFGTRAPAITINPYNRNLFKGSNTLFAAKASGAQPMFYQWQFNGTNVVGATNDTLSLTNLQFAQSGAYQLVVSNRYGVTTSKAGKLLVTLPLADSIDQTQSTITSSGAAQWFGQTNVTHDGIDAAQSGNIGDGQETILQSSVKSGGGQVSFWWKVSSESGFDFLEFRINGVVQASISGETGWQQQTFPIPGGTTLLQWRYYKDASRSGGQDTAWVDQVAFPPVITSQPTNQTVNAGATVNFSFGLSGFGPFTYFWKQNGTNLVGTGAILTLNNIGRAANGTYSVTVTNAGGSATSSNAVLKVLVPQQIGAPTLLPDGSFRFTSGDADGGQLSQSDLANFELQASQDLLTWQTLSNSLALTNGTLLFHDANQTNFPARYYRILEH